VDTAGSVAGRGLVAQGGMATVVVVVIFQSPMTTRACPGDQKLLMFRHSSRMRELNDPKSGASRRTLPFPDRLVSALRGAKARQAAERLALGSTGGAWEYVVCNEVGHAYAPGVLSRYWRDTVCGRASATSSSTLRGIHAPP
jgi:hypothetical protein